MKDPTEFIDATKRAHRLLMRDDLLSTLLFTNLMLDKPLSIPFENLRLLSLSRKLKKIGYRIWHVEKDVDNDCYNVEIRLRSTAWMSRPSRMPQYRDSDFTEVSPGFFVPKRVTDNMKSDIENWKREYYAEWIPPAEPKIKGEK